MSAAPAPFRHPPKRVPLEAVEAELNLMWQHPEQAEEVGAHLVRACMSNLIVMCVSEDEAHAVEGDLPVIVEHHPCRVLMLIAQSEKATDGIEAEVSAHISAQQQVFSEQVTLRAGPKGLARFPSLVRALTVADLPTSMWWTSRRPPTELGEAFQELSELILQLVYDTCELSNPAAGVLAVARWLESTSEGRSAADLAWRRLKPWRRMLSQVLDPKVAPGALEGIEEVRLEHGPHALPEAWLLVAWLAFRLGWRPGDVTVKPNRELDWEFDREGRTIKAAIRRSSHEDYALESVNVTWRDGAQRRTATLRRVAPTGQLVVYEFATGHPLNMMLPLIPRPLLVARQLSRLGRDETFLGALTLVHRMAEKLV